MKIKIKFPKFKELSTWAKILYILTVFFLIAIYFNIGYYGMQSAIDARHKSFKNEKLNAWERFQTTPLDFAQINIETSAAVGVKAGVKALAILIWPLLFLVSVFLWLMWFIGLLFVFTVESIKWLWIFIFKGGFFHFIASIF